ncbi:MBL fold metallo-hydrolase [Rhizobium oryzicola]|uniref:MBL fold metallo-hydrolase n=1 Tax=Rhizobium oryzicola TaxID=1232668 RepID=A0ABT8SUR0_9HYPH|nr:MBL fold metallo-hydrolase [Rhizobium oryzicola]MDO1582175.1 MBL fold metallo-hydrolase [Rhizobium oryzicola]
MSIVRHFGPYEVFVLRDGQFEAPAKALVHTGGESKLEAFKAQLGSDTLPIDVNCFLLRGPNGLTLIDSGCGTAWGENFGKARQSLEDMGIFPMDIDQILITHIHTDHVLGLFDEDEAYFPRALILVPAEDFAFFTDPEAKLSVPPERRGGFDLAEKIERVYGDRLELIEDALALESIEAYPLPGHTPGHTGYRIGSGNEALMVIGDALHLANHQPSDPDLAFVFDLDPVLAAETRKALLQHLQTSGDVSVGGHTPGFGRLKTVDGVLRIVAEE